jgi:DNA-binding transcriptional ArsR family regulator/DNA-binding CsgD family transcriptional regulator
MNDMLMAVGLDPTDHAVYIALLSGPATVETLAAATGLGDDTVQAALGSLEEAGLVGRAPGAPTRYLAAPPDVALEALLLRQEERLQRARLYVRQLTERYRLAIAGQDPTSLVEVVTGRVAVLQRFEQVQRSARTEIRAIDKPPYAAAPGNYNPVEVELLGRGIRYRVIYDPGGLADFHDLHADLERSASLGEEARVLPRAPTKLILADDRIGLIPLQAAPATIESIVVVHPSALLRALGALFESLWTHALPLSLHEQAAEPDLAGYGPTQEERRLLALLTTGVPDVVIARQLGLSYRTYQRRLQELMRRLDAETRFQAGMRAVLLGWIPGGG